MNELDLITKAIEAKKPICFEYIVENKVVGKRYGNPHALFLHPTTNNLMVHIYQVSGVSDTKDKLPGWRQPLLSHIKNIIILEEADCFELDTSYKPNSPMYSRIIAKV
jgi:hypothetical protein